jgi:hypothetical protein
VLPDLLDSLKLKVSIFINKSMFEKVPVFEGVADALVEELFLHLKPSIFPAVRTSDVGDCVSSDGNTVFATHTPGSYFGETALLRNQPRNASVRAVESIYTQNRTTLGKILEKCPAFQKHFCEIAAEREIAPAWKTNDT